MKLKSKKKKIQTERWITKCSRLSFLKQVILCARKRIDTPYSLLHTHLSFSVPQRSKLNSYQFFFESAQDFSHLFVLV